MKTPHQPSHPLNGHPNPSRTWIPQRLQRSQREDGSYIGEAPPSQDSRWLRTKAGDIPPVNFGMREDKTATLVSAAHAVAATGQPKEAVRQRGLAMFEATWAQQRVALETRQACERRDTARLEAERETVMAQIQRQSPTVTVVDGRLSAPTGWRLALLVGGLLALAILIACEWFSAALLRRYELQSLPLALLVTSPFVGLLFAIKLLLRPHATGVLRTGQMAFHLAGLVAVLLWLALLTFNYGTALREDHELPARSAAVLFCFAQIGAALACSAWLTQLLGSLFTPQPVLKPNPERRPLEQRAASLDAALNRCRAAIGEAEADLAAYHASRTAWIAIGEDAYDRSRHLLSLIEARIRFLDGE